MVARRFLVRYEDDSFDLDYYTVDGIEVFKFRLFSLASIPPDQQKILGGDGDREIEILEDADLVDAPSQVKLVSVNEEDDRNNDANADLVMSDEELARMPQAEEEALEQRIQPYVA